MIGWFKKRSNPENDVPSLLNKLIEPAALARAIAETISDHFRAVERGERKCPAYKDTAELGVLEVWKFTRLEALRCFWGHGASDLSLLAEHTEQSYLLKAFFEDKPQFEYPHAPNGNRVQDTLQALFQTYI